MVVGAALLFKVSSETFYFYLLRICFEFGRKEIFSPGFVCCFFTESAVAARFEPLQLRAQHLDVTPLITALGAVSAQLLQSALINWILIRLPLWSQNRRELLLGLSRLR